MIKDKNQHFLNICYCFFVPPNLEVKEKLTILRRIENEFDRTRHVVFAFTFAHVVHGTVGFIRVVGNVAIFFFTR